MILRIEVIYQCTFNTIKCTSFAHGKYIHKSS